MTTYKRGDVVLVNFIFPDETGVKRRPAVVLSTQAYHQGRQESIIAAVTSNVRRALIGDYLLSNWQGAGLLYPSVVTAIIRTVKQSMLSRYLGTLRDDDLDAVSSALRSVLGMELID